jgi:hypothetical protein
MTKKNSKKSKVTKSHMPVGINDVDILSGPGIIGNGSSSYLENSNHNHNHNPIKKIDDGLSNGLDSCIKSINKGLIDDKPKSNQLNDLLFDNPMSRAIMKSMSPEEIHQYKTIGEELYGNIDFEKSEVLNNAPPFISKDVIAYISSGIQSGLHPRDLDENEKAIMVESFGNDWFEKFGYSKEEM